MKRNTSTTIVTDSVGEVKITYHRLGDGFSNWSLYRHYIYRVFVETMYGKMSFKFHDSAYNYRLSKNHLDESDLVDAIGCVMNDVMTYIDNEFVYADEKRSNEVKAACKREYDGIMRVCGYDNDVFNDFVAEIFKTATETDN